MSLMIQKGMTIQMIKYEDECVGCPSEIGCLGSSCPNRNIPHTYCDRCEDEAKLYAHNDNTEQLCKKCMNKEFELAWKELSFEDKCEIFGVKEITI